MMWVALVLAVGSIAAGTVMLGRSAQISRRFAFPHIWPGISRRGSITLAGVLLLVHGFIWAFAALFSAFSTLLGVEGA